MVEYRPAQLIHHQYKGPHATFDNPVSRNNNWVILAVDQGVFEFQIGNQTGEASFGDLVFCPPKTLLHRRALMPLSLYYLVFKYSESDSHEDSILHIPTGKVTLHDQARRLTSNFSYIRLCTMPKDHIQQSLLNHVVNDLIMFSSIELRGIVKRNDKYILQASDYIREHFREELRMHDLAKKMGFNPSQFTRRFHSTMGMNPIDYLTSLRLDSAKSLLLETEDTIDTIAVLCGFRSGFYLSRVFTSQFKITPSQYRKNYRI